MAAPIFVQPTPAPMMISPSGTPPPPDLPTYAELCPTGSEYRWSESNEDWICGICPASKVANQGHLEGETHVARLLQWGHRFPSGKAVYERRAAQLLLWRTTGQQLALVGPPPPPPSLAVVPGPPPPGPPPGVAKAVPPSPPGAQAAPQQPPVADQAMQAMTRMLLTMTGSMARLSEEVREMRQAIDISNQQIAEFKQHILDIKNQIIASHQPPTRDEVSRAAAHSGAADGGATDGGAAAAPWFWQRVEPPMVAQTMVVGNEVESLMVERMQLGNLKFMVQPMVVLLLLLRCGREVEPLLRLGRGVMPPMVIVVRLLLHHRNHRRGILGDAIWAAYNVARLALALWAGAATLGLALDKFDIDGNDL